MDADNGYADFGGCARHVWPINEWLTERIHRHGKRFTTPEIIQQATGEPLTVDYFLGYLEE